MIVTQLLTAVFDPSTSNSMGTKLYATVFSRHDLALLNIFNITDNCLDIVTNKIPSIIEQFKKCMAVSSLSPPYCGNQTNAIKALEEVAALAKNIVDKRKALILLTSGPISTNYGDKEDPLFGEMRLKEALARVNESGVTIRIAAQSDDVHDPSLEPYASRTENVLDDSDPVQLGIEIVERLVAEGVLCSEQGIRDIIIIIIADDVIINYIYHTCTGVAIKESLGQLRGSRSSIPCSYCECIESRSGGKCEVLTGVEVDVEYKFPTCGGMHLTIELQSIIMI